MDIYAFDLALSPFSQYVQSYGFVLYEHIAYTTIQSCFYRTSTEELPVIQIDFNWPSVFALVEHTAEEGEMKGLCVCVWFRNTKWTMFVINISSHEITDTRGKHI